MKSSRLLPVLMPNIADQRWSCHSCGNCCRTLVIHLTPQERERLDSQGWAEKLGVALYVRIRRGWVLNKRSDGACVFLDENTRCRIHTQFGESSKPLACQIFPFSVRAVQGAWQASLRFDCPSVVSSVGKPLAQHRSWLTHLVEKLNHRPPRGDDSAPLQRGVWATPEEIGTLVARFVQWLKSAQEVGAGPSPSFGGSGSGERVAIEDGSGTLTPTPLPETEMGSPAHSTISTRERLIGCARITALLYGARFKRVRGPRFVELLDLLFAALPNECVTAPEPATARQLGMVRQLAFAYAEHVTLQELSAGWLDRIRKRREQLRAAGLFLKGAGVVPPLPGFQSNATFEGVDSVGPATERLPEVEELLLRYLIARLESHSTFGDGYYGWPVFVGLGALCVSVAVIGWLTRYAAASREATAVSFADLARVLGIVDRAATRVPALGTMPERVRVSYLFEDDGIARVIDRYSLVRRDRS